MQQRLPALGPEPEILGLIRDLMNHRIRLDDIVVSVETEDKLGGLPNEKFYASFAIGAVVLLAPFAASSHFGLLEPTNLLVQNNRGDPQKLAPCGGTSEDPGTPTNAITEAVVATAPHQDQRNGLPSGPLSSGLGSELHRRTAARPGNHHASKPTWSAFGLCEDRSEPEAAVAGGRAVRPHRTSSPGRFP